MILHFKKLSINNFFEEFFEHFKREKFILNQIFLFLCLMVEGMKIIEVEKSHKKATP
jgi:hypothetical protein